MGAALIAWLICFSPSALAEESAGDVIATRRQTELRKEPSPDAESLGILPPKSIVTLTGEEKGRFLQVEVELEEGTLMGWVEVSAIRKKKKVEAEEGANTEEEPEKKVIQVKKYPSKKKVKRIAVPQDEGVLLRRDPSFSYGAVLGAHMSKIAVEEPIGDYLGSGFSLGASISFLLDPNFRLRTELTYTSHSGTDENDRFLGMGFMDLAATGEIPLGSSFFILGGFQYSIGLGLDNSSLAISQQTITGASDLSGFWAQAGVGYRFSVGEQSFLSIRGRYAGALMISPVGIHSFGLQLIWEIEG